MYITWGSSVIAVIRYRQDGSYDSWIGFCLLTAASSLELDFIQPPFQCWVFFFLRLKWAQYEVGCLPQSRADVKNAESYAAMTRYTIMT